MSAGVCRTLGVEHETMKADVATFVATTVRLPHVPHEEAYQDDGDGGKLWMRNCAGCSTTISLPVAS